MAMKVLGQQSPAANSSTDLYAVAAAKSAVFRVVVCNRGVDTTFRISISVGGGAIANKDYIVYDDTVPANGTMTYSGLTAAGGDIVRVMAGTNAVSFTVVGDES